MTDNIGKEERRASAADAETLGCVRQHGQRSNGDQDDHHSERHGSWRRFACQRIQLNADLAAAGRIKMDEMIISGDSDTLGFL